MSKILINQYYQNLDRTLQFGKSHNEQSIRNHFWHLLNDYARKSNYEVIPEVAVMGTRGKKVYPDGTVKNLWGLDIGLWESKDEKDDIEAEIDAKIQKGYPLTNILFEDSNLAVLFQLGEEVGRAKMRNADQLHDLLTTFINFKSETVFKFEEAIEKFKADIPVIVETLRYRIIESREINPNFIAAQSTFLELCKAEINPDITIEDIREMMIQHLLTSDIFNRIFDDPDFHRHNTIAAELEKLIDSLFSYSERRNLLHSIEHYYEAINATAASITDHHEKQKFLKVIYENFYKVYNPKAADRLGVVYTPNEIVRFMVDSTNYLLHKHFGKTMADRNVEILDPATGTGTFICDVIEHVIPKQDLAWKYKNEIYANEVAILPYYIANLNIEYTFKQKMLYYAEFPNLCFVDTLDNTDALAFAGKQHTLFRLSSENTERIRRQNSKKISVVIGNPPYNANQLNENENNKNREYPTIDKRIKDTYIKHSTAQKTKLYDMYSRFYRWSMDRLDNNGILAFITNRSFIDSRTFDGFRKCVQDEYAYAYIVDTKSDVRANPKIAGTTHNVFGIQTGVAIMFLIKKEKQEGPCRIEYVAMEDDWRKEVKLDWLKNNQIAHIHFETIHPDKTNNWINLSEDNDWEELLPVADKDVKLGKSKNALFELFSLGVVTNRDEWVYDENELVLKKKVQHLITVYNADREKLKGKDKNAIKDEVDSSIKWTRAVKNDLFRNKEYKYDESIIINSLYRPFVKRKLYFSKELNEMQYLMPAIFGKKGGETNFTIYLSGQSSSKPFSCFSTQIIAGLDYLEKTQCLPLYRYNKSGNRTENITDWGLEQFREHYGVGIVETLHATSLPENETETRNRTTETEITKTDIFHYTYAVLHNPAYRKKYELNLKREFPRLPFYDNFHQWAAWGKALMELHIGYETVEPFALEVITAETKVEHLQQKTMFPVAEEPEAIFARKPKIKAKLMANKQTGIVEIDELTFLKGIPKIAWEYKLGNRSALEWVLDQYKEKKPKDPTIAEKFDTYRFSDYKDHVIDLLKRVCTVSVETMKIVGEMEST
ncbi:MAG TPA: DNA methyltransferase [Prolixibacteraceae bacterium]|nr:DNA methyltransferase [Prolixibacteraceae bacterium]